MAQTSRSDSERLRRSVSFNRVAEQYDRARPAYPNSVFEEVWKLARVPVRPDVLEIGCGTGQASVALAKRQARLTCVEYGSNMARIARDRLEPFPTARVEVGRFEDWEPGGRRFDLVFAASAWHWIDPAVAYRKAASALRSGGCLAIVSSEHAYPPDYDRLFDPIQAAYGEVTGSRLAWPPMRPEDIPDGRKDMVQSGCFEAVRICRVLWSFVRTAKDYVDLLGTYSDNIVMEPEMRDRLFKRIHEIIASSPTGKIRKHYLSTIRVGQKA